MDELELRLERLADRIELVCGAGDPGTGRMCIMAFVACLAGEGHTDHPSCASPVIRAFAIPINDRMPGAVRRRLKPFAPRILGTNDGLDRARGMVLRRALAQEILPKLAEGCPRSPAAPPTSRGNPVGRLWSALRRRALHRRIVQLLEEGSGDGEWPGHEVRLARAAGTLLGLCAGRPRDAEEAEWCWNTAIGLLDRLCDVGPPHGRQRMAGIKADRLANLEEMLRASPGANGPAPAHFG
jgi:hypothetical protein